MSITQQLREPTYFVLHPDGSYSVADPQPIRRDELKVFAVGDSDFYAAHCTHHALYLANEMTAFGEYDLDDVIEMSDVDLDRPIPELDEDENPTNRMTSIRAFLSEATEAGWLCGSDW